MQNQLTIKQLANSTALQEKFNHAKSINYQAISKLNSITR